MATPPQQYDAQQTIDLIDQKAKSVPERGVFAVKVFRKGPGQMLSQQVASFDNATVEHLSNPARWLLQLGGGGEWSVRVAHMDSAHVDIGGPLYFPLDTKPPNGVPLRPIDASATFRDGWNGPPVMTMPPPVPPGIGMPPGVRDMVFNGTQYAPQGQPGQVDMTSGYGMPQTPGQFGQPQQPQQQPQNPFAARETDLTRRERELLEKEARLREDAAAREAKIREDRLTAQLEAKNRELDLKLAQITTASAQAPKTDSSGWIKELLAGLLPLVGQMLTMQHEMRKISMEQSTAQSRAALDAAEKNHQSMMEFIRAAQAPKPDGGMNEHLRMLIDVLMKREQGSGAEGMTSMMKSTIEAMNIITKSSIAQAQAAADIFAPEQEHPAVQAIREGAKAVGLVMAGMRDGTRKSVSGQQALPGQGQPQRAAPPQPVQVPPGYTLVPTAQLHQAQQRAQAIRANAAAAANRERAAAAATVASPVATVPDPVPGPAPTTPTPPAEVTTFPPHPGTPSIAPAVEARPTPLDQLEAMIRQQADLTTVAGEFVRMLQVKDEGLFAALRAAGGDPDVAIIERLGMDFVTQHQEYLEALSDEIDEQAGAAGLTEDGPGPETVDGAVVEQPNGAVEVGGAAS